MTIAELVKRYIELRDFVEADSKAVEERQQPYKTAMGAIEGAVQQILIDAGADNIKTEHGTAYRTTHLQVKLADRNAFEQFIVQTGDLGYFTNAVSKDKIREYIDANGAAPPGVDTVTIAKTNFRRS